MARVSRKGGVEGHDVAVRIFSYLPRLAPRGADIDAIIAGTELSLERIANGRGFVDWATYETIAQRSYEALPDDAIWFEVGEEALDMPSLRVFGLVASMFSDPIEAFRWWSRGFGPASAFVPYLDYELVEVGEGVVHITVSGPPDCTIPRTFWAAMHGAITRLPTLLGREAPKVTVKAEGRRVQYDVELGPQLAPTKRLMATLRAAVARFGTEEVRAAHEALYEQNRILIQRMNALADAEAERANLTARLEEAQRMEAIGRLAGGIAHDFNNVLTVLGGRAQLLAQHDDAEAREHGEHLLNAVEQGSRLIAQLLSFSREQPQGTETLCASEVVGGLREMLRTLVGERHSFTFALAPSPIALRFNRSHLEQVVVNLVVNARDAIEGSGTIEVAVRHRDLSPDQSLRHPDAREGRYAELAVRDDGLGMDEATRQRAFEPFFTTKRETQGGTGLGLATVYGLVRQAGGFVELASRPGRGTTVRVLVPALAGEELTSPRPSKVPTSHPGARKGRILVVEDQPSVRSLLQRVLRRVGHEVLCAETPKQALTMFDAQFDLLVTDVVMPELTGPELAAKLRERRPELPILFVSGYAERGVFDSDALPAKSAFLRKPFQLEEIYGAVEALLPRGIVDAEEEGS